MKWNWVQELTKELRQAEQQWMDDSEKGALIAAEAAVAALLKSDSPGLTESAEVRISTVNNHIANNHCTF